MKSKRLGVAAGMLLAVSPAIASDIGSVTIDIKSNGQDSVSILPGTTTLPLEIYFSATTAGTEGSNNGVSAIFMNLTGPAIAGVMQGSVTLDSDFVNSVADGGLGFDLIADSGTPGVGQIAGFGGSQALPIDMGIFPFEFSLSRDAANVGHSGNVLMGTATLNLASLSAGTVTSVSSGVSTSGGANLWDIGFHSTQRATVNQDYLEVDDLIISVIPEPATMGLLALAAGMAMVRRRG